MTEVAAPRTTEADVFGKVETHGIEAIPADAAAWGVSVRSAEQLAMSLAAHRVDVTLYKVLATLRRDAALKETLAELEWRGADRAAVEALARELGDRELVSRVPRWRS
jgi:hypothetical protein